MQTTISKSVAAKAERLISDGKVSRVKGHVYRVQGDSGIYTVHVSYPQEVSGMCDCPAKGVCSHLIAACAFDLANPQEPSTIADPFEGII
jgi:uncharacterized Zn finger protein